MDAKNRNQNYFSIIIISYNQEKYIKDAILSAFNQNFNNYEIIISDDCSTDNTWNIINETVAKEKNKRDISTCLNRNENNLGIVRNYQKALSLTKGNWIVASAGDDISKPNRLQVISSLVIANKNIFAIGTGFDLINESGGYISKNNPCIKKEINLPLYPGFSAAINRDTFTKFPNILENIQSEDIIYTLRAFELGKIILTNTSIVKHRIHSNNITSKGTSSKAYIGKILNHENAIKTLNYYKNNELQNEKLIPIIDRQIKKFEENIKHYEFITFYYKMNLLKKILNFSKIKLPVEHRNFYNFLYRIKIFCESYNISKIEKIYFLLKSYKKELSSKKDKLQKIKTYYI